MVIFIIYFHNSFAYHNYLNDITLFNEYNNLIIKFVYETSVSDDT